MLIFLYVEEKWMKGEQVSTLKHIQTRYSLFRQPHLSSDLERPLVVGAQLL